MKYEVKKSFWHCNRPVAVGEVLDLDPIGARWLVGQGKVVPVGTQESGGRDQESKGRRGRRAAPQQNHEPVLPDETKGDEQ